LETTKNYQNHKKQTKEHQKVPKIIQKLSETTKNNQKPPTTTKTHQKTTRNHTKNHPKPSKTTKKNHMKTAKTIKYTKNHLPTQPIFLKKSQDFLA